MYVCWTILHSEAMLGQRQPAVRRIYCMDLPCSIVSIWLNTVRSSMFLAPGSDLWDFIDLCPKAWLPKSTSYLLSHYLFINLHSLLNNTHTHSISLSLSLSLFLSHSLSLIYLSFIIDVDSLPFHTPLDRCYQRVLPWGSLNCNGICADLSYDSAGASFILSPLLGEHCSHIAGYVRFLYPTHTIRYIRWQISQRMLYEWWKVRHSNVTSVVTKCLAVVTLLHVQ